MRHSSPRRDWAVRDMVLYSILRGEWPKIKAHLHYKRQRG